MKKCLNCGFENEDNSNFCAECCSDKFESDNQPSKKGGLNIGDANAIDANELIGHKEEVHGNKEEIHGNKEEINAQNYTVNQTIVNQTTNIDAEVIELEKQKRLIEMEKMKFETELMKAKAMEAHVDASTKSNNLKAANEQANEISNLQGAVAQREAELGAVMAMMEQLVVEQEKEEEKRKNDKSSEIARKRKSLIETMDNAIYSLERASQSTLSGEIGRKSPFLWGGVSISLFILAAATTIPFFWILLVTTTILTVTSTIKQIKLGKANANSLKKDELVRTYQSARRDLNMMSEKRDENNSLISEYDKRLTQSQSNHESGVKGASIKATIIVSVLIILSLVIAVATAAAVISTLPE